MARDKVEKKKKGREEGEGFIGKGGEQGGGGNAINIGPYPYLPREEKGEEKKKRRRNSISRF